jgi:putative oxidoreductase
MLGLPHRADPDFQDTNFIPTGVFFPPPSRCCNLFFFLCWRNSLRFLDRLQPLALLVMRLALGFIFLDHGYHKVFGGLHHHVQFVTSLGLPAWSAYLSAFTEFFGGILVLIGLFTRVAAFAICINMCVAIVKVHFHNGLMGNNGYEFPLALAALAFALVCFDGGPIAFDHIRAPGGGGWKSK